MIPMATILVADDAAFMRLRLRSILEGAGHEVVEACNGAEAVEAFAGRQPDAVLLDITMPVMDGITALKSIHASDPEARVAMCSALGQQSMVLQAIQSGARDFIVKPFEPERVLAALDRLLSPAVR
jgi:two-component system chemotaxis response regulator CheY